MAQVIVKSGNPTVQIPGWVARAGQRAVSLQRAFSMEIQAGLVEMDDAASDARHEY